MLAHNQSSIIKSSDEARQREGRQARSNYMSQPCAEPCHVMRMIPAPSSNLYVPHITLHGGLTHGHARSLSTGPLLAPVSPTAMRTPRTHSCIARGCSHGQTPSRVACVFECMVPPAIHRQSSLA